MRAIETAVERGRSVCSTEASVPSSIVGAVARPAPPNLPTAPITETATAVPRVDERPRMRYGSWYQSQLIPLGGMLLVFVYAAWQVSLLVERGAVAR